MAMIGHKFLNKLAKAGMPLPDNCCRVVIDIPADGVVMVYTTCSPDNDELSVDLLAGLAVARPPEGGAEAADPAEKEWEILA